MGNTFSYSKSNNFDSKYEPFLTSVDTVDYSQVIRRLEIIIDGMKLDIQSLQEINNRLEIQLARMNTLMQNKNQEMQNSIFNCNERIAIITKDMESLLNNDKLLLDKLIEKNIVSTIQEEHNLSSNKSINSSDDIYKSA